MSDTDKSVDSKKDDQGKNIDVIYCSYCPSKILNPGSATYVNIDYSLPHILCKNNKEERESINDYWLVEDINNFENIGVSYKVDNMKYLACADCERGPVGWHDLATLQSYIALCRVKHGKSSS